MSFLKMIPKKDSAIYKFFFSIREIDLKVACYRIFCYVIGQILAHRRYDKKYLTGKYFWGDRSGRFAIGWEWVVKDAITCKRMRVNQNVPWPVSPRIIIAYPENIDFHPDDLNIFQGAGIYYQAFGKIVIGKGTYIAPNVGLITANHDLLDPDMHMEPKPIMIGEKCWIAMNAVVLPGVTLGDHTVVAAGAVVTKSFPEGYCVIAGVPATIIKKFDSEELDKRHAES